LALNFARNGYAVILNGRNKKNLAAAKKEIGKEGVRCEVCEADLATAKGLEKAYRVIRSENISVFVNNAGLHCPYIPFEQVTDGQIDVMIRINLVAALKLTRRIYEKFLKRSSGTIININSMCGLEGHKLRTIYSASKWGLRGFAECLRLESAGKGIRILDVYPTRIMTIPAYTHGMETGAVAEKIFNVFKRTNSVRLVIDDRKQAKK